MANTTFADWWNATESHVEITISSASGTIELNTAGEDNVAETLAETMPWIWDLTGEVADNGDWRWTGEADRPPRDHRGNDISRIVGAFLPLPSSDHTGQCGQPGGAKRKGDETMTLDVLARLMMLTPAQAVALPATIDCAARKCGMSRGQMVDLCAKNAALRDYLAGVCRKVTR